jgi:hypothetical protein
MCEGLDTSTRGVLNILGNNRQRKHHRFVDDQDLRSFCEGLREMNSLPTDGRLSRWERHAGKHGEGLRLFNDSYDSASDLKEKAAVLADMRNVQELVQEVVDAIKRCPGRDQTKYSREIRKISLKWLAMLTEGKLPTSTDEMHQELLQMQAVVDDQQKPARKTPTVRRDPWVTQRKK